MKLDLDLELNEINMILGALGNLPYGQVEPLITKLRTQITPQLPKDVVPVDANNTSA